MASDTDHSVTIIAKSGDRVLTTIVYPDMSYVELVAAQAAIALGLLRAGFQRADFLGDEIPPPLMDLFGIGKK